MEIIRDRDIAAILPRYTCYGDRTVIIDAEGHESAYSLKPATLLAKIGSRNCKDLRLLRIWARKYTYQRLWIPLGFSWELVLIPMRVRDSKINGDTTIGYFNFVYINRLEQEDSQVCIIMENGLKFPILWGLATVRKHLKDAMLLHSMLTHNLDDMLWSRLHRATGLHLTSKK